MSLELVVCTPLHARLTLAACTGRYRKANRVKRAAGHDALRGAPYVDSACRGCPIGAERLAASAQKGQDSAGRKSNPPV